MLLDGLVARIRRSHRRGPGSIPGQGIMFTSIQGLISLPYDKNATSRLRSKPVEILVSSENWKSNGG